MKDAKELKEIVRQKYGEIADQNEKESTSCCGPDACGEGDSYTVFADNYEGLEGYAADADLKLGCGLPTEHAHIQPGSTVVDLGSGAGNDCFVARSLTGEEGKIIGLDFTEKMVNKARQNASSLGYDNVEFILGEIEDIPLENDIADVVVSNCVMNLVPSKVLAFAETYRILKPGGHFSISDIVLHGNLPEGLQEEASLYAGCVSGAIQMEEYLTVIDQAGFKNVQVQKKKKIDLPQSVYNKYISNEEWAEFVNSGSGIFSITVYGEK